MQYHLFNPYLNMKNGYINYYFILIVLLIIICKIIEEFIIIHFNKIIILFLINWGLGIGD